MFDYDPQRSVLIGPGGTLQIPPGDQASLKMAMLLQGECTEIGPRQAAKIFQYSKSRYYQRKRGRWFQNDFQGRPTFSFTRFNKIEPLISRW